MTLCPKMTLMRLHLFQWDLGQAAHQAVHHHQVELSAYRLALEAHHRQVELSAYRGALVVGNARMRE